MSEAASVGGSEKVMSKAYTDEIKYGAGYVKRYDPLAPAKAKRVPVTPQTPRQPQSMTSAQRSPLGLPGADRSDGLRTVDAFVFRAPLASPHAMVADHTPLTLLQGALEADPALIDDLWDDERAPRRQRKRKHNRVRGASAARRAAHIARISWLFSLYDPFKETTGDRRHLC
ncbi:MAG: hypothetical protein AAFX94_08485 [Myxococcota bacterium]